MQFIFRSLRSYQQSGPCGSITTWTDTGDPTTNAGGTKYPPVPTTMWVTKESEASCGAYRCRVTDTNKLVAEVSGSEENSTTFNLGPGNRYNVYYLDANDNLISTIVLDLDPAESREFVIYEVNWRNYDKRYYCARANPVVRFPKNSWTSTETRNYRTTIIVEEVTEWYNAGGGTFRGVPWSTATISRDYDMMFNYEVTSTTYKYEYLIRFDTRGGTGTIPQINLKEKTTATMDITMPTAEPTLTDFTFVGWSTTSYEPGQGSAQYYAGQTYNMNYGLTQLYAVYASKVSVKANVNGQWMQTKPYVKVDGQWREVTGVKVKVNGEWKDTTQ